MKKAFVTGATGFIGLNLVKELVDQGWQVTALHRASSNLRFLSRNPVSLVAGDLEDPQSLLKAMPEAPDAVFHVAADTTTWSRRKKEQLNTNVDGTRNVIQAALQRSAKRLIFTSTAATYGIHPYPVSEKTQSTASQSKNIYEHSKWLAEQEVHAGIKRGLPAVILNPCAVMGPQDISIWGSVFSMIRDGKVAILPPGSVPVNHVSEIVKAHVVAVDKGRSGEHYILSGEHASFASIFREIAALQNIKLKSPVVPGIVFKTLVGLSAWLADKANKEPDMTPEMASILCHDNQCQTDKAERELNYRIIPVSKSLQDSYRWLCAEGLL